MDSKLYSKCKIIADVYNDFHNDSRWREYFRIYDVAVPLSIMVVNDWAEPTNEGVNHIDEAWLALCKIIMVDSDEEYEFLSDMLEIGAISE